MKHTKYWQCSQWSNMVIWKRCHKYHTQIEAHEKLNSLNIDNQGVRECMHSDFKYDIWNTYIAVFILLSISMFTHWHTHTRLLVCGHLCGWGSGEAPSIWEWRLKESGHGYGCGCLLGAAGTYVECSGRSRKHFWEGGGIIL